MAAPKMSLHDWLDDLCVRFLVNLPPEHLGEIARICFAVEEAQWFYEDFIRPLDPQLPSMPLRLFCMKMFQHCPLLASFSQENHMKAFEEFMNYKTRVPVRGAIMLNQEMDSALLVKGWKKSAGWSFPRGKINKDEDDLECAIREVDEETGFDIRAAGLVPKDEPVKYIDIPMREQNIRLYVFRGVPMDTKFHPRTRKEISKIQWWKLSDLPAFRKKGGQNDPAPAEKANKFYMVAPFLVHLRKWVVQQKKRDATRQHEHLVPQPSTVAEEPVTEDDTWAHASAPLPPKTVPNPQEVMTSLEDTTRELHRLLNIQPPTVPVKPPTDENKGATLLALLQSKSAPNTAAPAPERSAMPSSHGTPQPQQAPPAAKHPHVEFPAVSYQYSEFHAAMSHQVQGQHSLVHPQPLPPQVRSLLASGSQPTSSGHQPLQGTGGGGTYHSFATERPQNQSRPTEEYKPASQGSIRQHPQFIQATSMPEPPQGLQALFQNAGKPTPPIDKHRSALLDMFKKPEAAPNDPQATIASFNTGPGPRHGTSENWQGLQNGTGLPSNATDAGDQIHRGLLSLLARPDGQYPTASQPKQPSLPVNLSPQTVAPGSSASPAHPNQRTGTSIPAASPLFNTIYGTSHNNASALTSPPPASALPPPSVLQPPPEHSAAHKQKLLSLFSKPSPQPAAALLDEARPPPPSAPTETPISSADRNFLLGYLESVTNKAL